MPPKALKRARDGEVPDAKEEPTASATTSPTEAVKGEHSPPEVGSSSQASDQSDHSSIVLGVYVWTEVSMILFYRLLKEIHKVCLAVANATGDESEQQRCIDQLEVNLRVIWEVGKTHLPAEEQALHESKVRVLTANFVAKLRDAVNRINSDSATDSRGDGEELTPEQQNVRFAGHIIATCRVLEKVLEEEGFPDDEGGSEGRLTGGLSSLVVDTRRNVELHCYSYAERTTMSLPTLPRYDGEKRSEEEYEHARVGHTVHLQHPHPHPEICTNMQLIEPKKRRTALDEYRIFSHPKKTATHGTEDFLVDEELNHRAYVALRHENDSAGSLLGVSPFARFLLWNVVLDRDDVLFDRATNQSPVTGEARRRAEEVRALLGAELAAFNAVRESSRRAAQRIGWYAISAQWRDQVLSRLEDVEDLDWYFLGDVAKLGGRAIFPNYAHTAAVRSLASAVVKKLDAHFRHSGAQADAAQAVAVGELTRTLFLPLLQGRLAPVREASSSARRRGSHDHGPGGSDHAREHRRLKQLMGRRPGAAAVGSTGGSSAEEVVPADSIFYYVTGTFVFPLQCVAELLELCSLAQFASCGMESFAAQLLSADWFDEEGVLRFLLDADPLNPAVAPMAAIPKVYRDLVTGVQLLKHEKLLPTVIEGARVAAELGINHSRSRAYAYWKALTTIFQEAERQDDLVMFSIDPAGDIVPGVIGQPLYREGVCERAARVWPEDVEDLLIEEKAYKEAHRL